ncbi:MAG TPA: RagB/SusD family nutrient uptake outer membrane protein [Chitinophagaceae bacterium]|nr:RagB/SusD family nutrient uptake outer membrane protein [Chitinophagaceae bacterium]
MNKNKFVIGLSILVLAGACSPKDLDKTNPNKLTPENFFKNSAELTKGVNSIYALLQSNNLVAREYFFLHDLRSDDAASGGGQLETPRNQILLGAQSPSNYVVNEVWNGLYRSILRSNTIINNAPNATDANSALSKRLLGEAQFLRAWSYMELVTMWGGVPIYTAVATSQNETQAKASEAEVYALIEQDLKAAQEVLPPTYSGSELGRATKGAAQMLLARAYMNMGDYAKAKAELQKMISSGVYKLMDDYNDNFKEETEWNQESVFEIGYASIGDVNWAGDGDDPSWGPQERTTRAQEYSPVGWRNLIPSNSLIAEFESTTKGDPKTDPRREYTFYVIGDKFNNGQTTLTDGMVQGNTSTFESSTTKVSWRKYSLMYKEDPGGYKTSGINHRIMRYADALLMMAECENELGSIPEALKYLNMIRARPSVQMPAYPTARYPTATKDQVFAAIVHERRVELAGEQVRNRDILRWRKNNKITITPVTGFNVLLPIPQAEIDNNDKISQADQNAGY